MTTDRTTHYCSPGYARGLLHSIVDNNIKNSSFLNERSVLFRKLISRLHAMADAFAKSDSPLTSVRHYFDTYVEHALSPHYWFLDDNDEEASMRDVMGLIDWESGEFSLGDVQAEFVNNANSADPEVAVDSFHMALKYVVMMKIASIIQEAIVDHFDIGPKTDQVLINHAADNPVASMNMDNMFAVVRCEGGMQRITMKELLQICADAGFIEGMPADK